MREGTDVFLEKDYESSEDAYQARNDRAALLTTQGKEVLCQDLVAPVSGRMVYVVQIIEPESDEPQRRSGGKQRYANNKRPTPRKPAVVLADPQSDEFADE